MDHSKLPLPLEGIRVVDCTHIVAGPFCSMLLGDAGAEVIKIERPGVGDRSRLNRSHLQDKDGSTVSGRFLAINRNKKSLALDMAHPRGKELFRQLVAVSDVVLDNYGPGALQRLGFGYDRLQSINPSVVYASITGYGNTEAQRGPYSSWAAHNPCVQGMAGWMNITGGPDGPPEMVGDNIGDSVPAVWTAYGVMLALQTRNRTGLGQHVDVAMYDCMMMHNTSVFPFYQVDGKAPGRQRENMTSAQLALEASDGYVVLAGAIGEEKWEALWHRVGHPELTEDPRYLGRDVEGPFYLDVIRPTLEEWTTRHPKREVTDLLLELGFSASMVQDAEDMMACPHLEAREMFVDLDYPATTGSFKAPSTPVKLSASQAMLVQRPPSLGEHTKEVLQGLLGLSSSEIGILHQQGVV